MLYHKDIFLPPLPLPKGRVKLTYSEHAKREAQSDHRSDVVRFLPASVDFRLLEIVEAELSVAGELRKLVVRHPMPDTIRDLVLVVSPGRGEATWCVRTVWTNTRDDHHSTLNPRRYAVA